MRYFIELAYDGINYHGWQVQPNGNSVQATVQKAISTVLREEIEIVGAGRTDTGVNASKMFAHFDFDKPFDSSLLEKKLCKILPHDIAVYHIYKVRDDAHARFDAISRTYQYHVTLRKDPFLRRYAWQVYFPLDFNAMNEAAKVLFEYTDFTSFSKLHTDVKTNNCKIIRAEWKQVAEFEWVFTIQADRFLRNMVRAIVGTLIDVGRGKLTVDGFRQIIEQRDRCAAGSSVPGNALFLVDITYPKDIFL
ncbi:MAG: tRNA pseudouridine(38-40) synthase TruA [Phocaeicola sp.]|uniref:tRNA pseudouridine(38-40) synthase TruA n=1 Tax=Phocaeicola TaxID=909656 RepID=UPI00234EC0FE|nr:tRNA pseudouridine(38-40) synthase TruA [Phocaeicola oris]MCE2616660.1 tRNA pseudouridine(38-40) synthase TruA [Phocaeicola oris]